MPIGVADIIDIAVVAYIVYRILLFIRGTSAGRLIKGIVLLLVALVVSQLIGLKMINFIISKAISIGVLALVIIFQPEIRRFLERFGGVGLNRLLSRESGSSDTERMIDQTVQACTDLSWSRYGALIVFEREDRLDDYIRTGTVIDATASAELMKNIFFPKAALHDGAMIIRDGRIAAAGCMLPMTKTNMNKEFGMRHRAGVGMSESSDALIIIVSEERGSISAAVNGKFTTNLNKDALDKLLKEYLVNAEETVKAGDAVVNFFKGNFKVKKNDKKDS
ncbi:MAG: diadenylate cyclase CdaA [Oscillospiraceae bacterium]|nr:diadenylate cyclase CdaA [Oscillospiraceae bacterium]